jgi:hypothetical protein
LVQPRSTGLSWRSRSFSGLFVPCLVIVLTLVLIEFRPFRDPGVDVSAVRAPFGLPLDAEAEELETPRQGVGEQA